MGLAISPGSKPMHSLCAIICGFTKTTVAESAGKRRIMAKGALIAAISLATVASHAREPATEQVGRTDDSRAVLPVSQTIMPAGQQIELPDMRPQVIRLSPDGKLLVTAGKTHDLVVIDPANGAILQHESLPSDRATEPEPEEVSDLILNPD